MKRLVLPVVILALLMVLLLPTTALAGSKLTFDQAVDQLVAQGYPQRVVDDLTSLGTTSMGWRDAGTAADNAAVDYFAAEMRRCGMRVWVEPVPIDVFHFNGASVTAAGETKQCSTYSCSTPTPAGGLTGQVVYVHDGTAADYDAFGPGYDWSNKVALVDQHLDYYFVDLVDKEATVRGVKAVIMSTIPGQSSMYKIGDGVLGGGPALCDKTDVPWVFMSRDDATWLKGLLPCEATVVMDATVTTQEDGGYGYNVFASKPGNVKPGELVVSMSHHDAHWFGACDNTTAMASQLTIAKAMKMSGLKPDRTVVFLSTTAEESGMTDAYYGWCIGSWYSITHQHSDWPGRVAGIVNLEMIGYKNGNMRLYANPELTPWLEQTVAGNPDIVGGSGPAVVYDWPWSWTDQWTYTAAGIPSVTMMPWSDWFQQNLYHTQFDTPEQIDWGFWTQNTKLQMVLMNGFGSGLLPYSFKARADDLAAVTNEGALLGAQADPDLVERFVADVADFQAAADAYGSSRATIPPKRIAEANAALMKAEAILNKAFTGLTPYDATVYPHSLMLADVTGLQGTIAALEADPTDATQAAYWSLSGVDLMWYGLFFSHDAFVQNLLHHDPAYERINWGGQGHLATPLDLWPESRSIAAGDGAAALPGLRAALEQRIADLEQRLTDESAALEAALPIIESL